MIPPDSSAFAHKGIGMEEALMVASSKAYQHLHRAVEHAVLTGANEIDVVQPEFNTQENTSSIGVYLSTG